MKYNSINSVLRLNSELSLWNIYYRYFRWWVYIPIAIQIGLLYCAYKIEYYTTLWWSIYLSVIPVLIIAIIIMRSQVSKIVDKKYSQEQEDATTSDKQITFKIREEIVQRKLNDSIWFQSKENFEYLILLVKERSNTKGYSFTFSKQLIVLVFITILLNGFISKLFDFAADFEELKKVFKEIGILFFLVVGWGVAIEFSLLRGIYEDRIKKQRRLLEILEEIHVEKFLLSEPKEKVKKSKKKRNKKKRNKTF